MPKTKKTPPAAKPAAPKAAAPDKAKPAMKIVDGKPVPLTHEESVAMVNKPKRGPAPPQLLRGMKDILPGEQKFLALLRAKTQELASAFGFDRIDTPVLEETALFIRGVGKQTDIVEKELFSFVDQGGESMTLRPEFTAAVARAYVNHGMWNQPQPVKLFKIGPVFRHERPQAGRYRQFTQAGFEIFGDKHPVIDAHLIYAAYVLFKEIGLDALVLVNSIGDASSREAYKNELITHYRAKRSQICENCKKRLQRNPLRVLDCKEEGCVAVKSEAPQIVDFLNEESRNHFMRVLEYLDELEVPYQLQPHLVRGLDYYNHTVFEVVGADDADKGGSQVAMAAGGRYDGLIETLGGMPTPAFGFDWGLERIVLRLKEKNVAVPEPAAPDIFIAQLGEPARRKMLALFHVLRKEGVRVAESFSRDALKQQLEIANRLGVRFTLILGQKEVLDGTVLIRDMDSGIQEVVDFKKAAQEVRRKLAQPAAPKTTPPPPPEPEETLLDEPSLKEEEADEDGQKPEKDEE